MIGLRDLKYQEATIKKLEELGYEYFGEANVPGRLYFRARGKFNYNIALCQYQSEVWNNNLIFRDYLLAHPMQAKRYGLAKMKIVDRGADTLLKYSDIKDVWVKNIIKKAKQAAGKLL